MDPNVLPSNEHLSEKQLKFGYWYVTHKLQIKKWFTFSLLVAAAFLWIFTIGMLVKLYLIDYPRQLELERALPQSLVNPYAIEAAQPKQLQNKPVQVFEGSKGATDVTTEVVNPNEDFWATWSGRFSAEGATTTWKMEYILPSESKEIADLGLEAPGGLRAPRYEMRDLSWHKVDRHQIADYKKFFAERQRFDIQNITFSSETSADNTETVSRVSFDVTNRSAWSYWSVKFVVNLYRGTTLAGVNTVELEQFETGETRRVVLIWVQDLQAISKVEVIPQVNILEPSSYMSQKGS
jgi:hypothetical protein